MILGVFLNCNDSIVLYTSNDLGDFLPDFGTRHEGRRKRENFSLETWTFGFSFSIDLIPKETVAYIINQLN